jgi:hypothetical protein
MLEYDSADTLGGKFSVNWGLSGGSGVHRPGSEDPPLRFYFEAVFLVGSK